MRSSIMSSWLLKTAILFLAFDYISEAKHEKLLPSSMVVVGTVYCDTCFQEEFTSASYFISGASVAVECGESRSGPSFKEEVKTNEHGEFKVSLPFSVTKHVKKIKKCSVKLISSNEPNCAVASSSSAAATSSPLHLKSRNKGIHIFSAGFFTFKPLKQPQLCNQKQVPQKTTNSRLKKPIKKSQGIAQDEFFKTVPQGFLFPSPPTAFGIPFPPNPFNPPSILPPNPLQPPPSIFPPNPFQPSPPSILPPNPLQPSPPPSIFPPNPFQPSPPIIGFPPIPFLTPPPPPPPAFPIPLPPIPFLPIPGTPSPPSSSQKTNP